MRQVGFRSCKYHSPGKRETLPGHQWGEASSCSAVEVSSLATDVSQGWSTARLVALARACPSSGCSGEKGCGAAFEAL